MTAVWSHRGRVAARPEIRENTPEAFASASIAGAEGIELDTWRTVDGEWVVRHDRETAHGDVDRLQAAEAPELPRLGPALGACAVASVNVELKVAEEATPAEAAALGGALGDWLAGWSEGKASKGRSPLQRLVVSSFSAAALAAARGRRGDVGAAGSGGQKPAAERGGAPGYSTGLLVTELPVPEYLAALVAAGDWAVHMLHEALDEETVGRCHDLGVAVVAWTVDEEDEAARLIGAGVDVLISNDPVRILAVRDALRE